MKRIEEHLRQTVGLDVATIGSGSIERTVRRRMRATGFTKPVEYLHVLENSPSEWGELLETLIVTETWFFRDPGAFRACAQTAVREWLPVHPSEPLRLLSVPCSSGEEPYSLAMALLDAGMPADRFRIEGVDLSARMLARARGGLYEKNAFRGKDLAFRDRYFCRTKEGFLLQPAVRDRVALREGNLLSSDFAANDESCDFIFCRNLLIYFDRPTQRRAFEHLSRLLAPGGVLFVGPAEQALALDHGFVSTQYPMAFGYRKSADSSLQKGRGDSARPLWDRLADAPERRDYGGPGLQIPADVAAEGELDYAKRLVTAGRLAEAAAVCEAHLDRNRASAEGYFLLGRVRTAGGDLRAGDCFRKALYLKPNHYESLLQLALLAEKRGDTEGASQYRRRAQRSRGGEVLL